MTSGQKITIEFNDKIVRQFLLAAVLWGAVGMLVGVLIATQLNFWQANFGQPFLGFGRLRPLHTNAVIFAFVGNMMFAGIYYSTQRLVKARLASDFLSSLHFWGWQLIIVAAAITLPLGLTRGKEYAELIWPINIAVAVIWVVFAVNFFWTLARRHEKSLYVAIWFYIATIITVAMLYIVNHLSIPTSLTHSYPVFGGVQDGLVQWWYGHNAVAFFLTAGFLGMMYYYLPKRANRPIFSYRMSIISFWGITFMYMWAGSHHLHYTALPHWVQTLGMAFSVVLLVPSWASAGNALLTLNGAWHKVRDDAVLRFMALAAIFYGITTFEGSFMAIRAVNSLSHYTDWTIGHVHAGALGWVAMITFGSLYSLVPSMFKRERIYSNKLVEVHFWLALAGTVIYVFAMWNSGVIQGLMWRTYDEAGTLSYSFLESLDAMHPYYIIRAFGGLLFLLGAITALFNVVMTIRMPAMEATPDRGRDLPAEPALQAGE